MTRLGRSVLDGLVTLWLIATLSFFVLRLAPGDPARPTDPTVPAAHAETLRRLYGLDRPILDQYGSWLAGLTTGNLGWSFNHRQPVTRVIGRALPPTLLLAGLGLALQYAMALGLALWAARRPGLRRPLDLVTTGLYAMPAFWLGLVALTWLGRELGLFPTFGTPAPETSTWRDHLHYAALPAVALALSNIAPVYRLSADALTRALEAPFVLAARARGVGRHALLWRHAGRNALPVTVRRLALDLPVLLSGSLVLEVLFSRPGLGRTAHQAFLARDYPILAAVTTAVGGLIVCGNLAADAAHAALDPRVDDG